MSQDVLRQWAEDIGSWHLPRWQELPQMELYMDQVVVFLETNLGGLWLPGEKFITAAMINNYVKQGMVPKPYKKRYGRTHMAHLVVITLTKQIMPLTEIKHAFQLALSQRDAAEVYDAFCQQQEQALAAAGVALLNGGDEHWQRLLQLSAHATASGLAVKSLVSMWKKDDTLS